LDLLDPKKTPKVPRAIRDMAHRCLRHYPSDFYLKDIFEDKYHNPFNEKDGTEDVNEA
jgi:hypothetical protein